jgi:hypothetical protein
MASNLLWCSLISVALFSCKFNSSTNADPTKDSGVAMTDADPNARDADPNAADAFFSAADAKEVIDGVSCGNDVCTSNEECCIDYEAQSSTCVDLETCSSEYTSKCDGPEDCPQVCCGVYDGDFGSGFGGGDWSLSTSCAASCQQDEEELCAVDDDCSQGGDVCCALDYAPASVCRDECGGSGYPF